MVHCRSWVLVLISSMVSVRACALPTAAANLMMACRRGQYV